MSHRKIIVAAGLITILALALGVQAQDGREGGPGGVQPVVVPPPMPSMGPGVPIQLMREQAEELRARAREAQELADRLRRQADELDGRAKQLMDRGRGPQEMEPMQRELREIKEAIGRAEREGRPQEAAELRQRAEQLMGRFQPMMQPGPRMEERQETKRQIERLRDEAQMAKEQGRAEDAQRIWQEAERLEQQWGGQGPRGKGKPGRGMPDPVQDILRSAEQAEREGRMEDARRQREKAEIVARQLREQKMQGLGQPDRQFKDEVMRNMEELRKEIGRLWQVIEEMRRPRD